jgi:hypothetical protein
MRRWIVLAASREADGGGSGMEVVLMVHLGFSLLCPTNDSGAPSPPLLFLPHLFYTYRTTRCRNFTLGDR